MNKLSEKQIERIQQTLFCSLVAMDTADKIRRKHKMIKLGFKERVEEPKNKGVSKMEFNWKDKETELQEQIKKCVKEHNDYIKSELVQFLANGEENYGKDWTAVLWWNGNNIECYECGALNDVKHGPKQLIDFYHFSKARTKVIICSTGEDITDKVEINPFYRDIFKDELLNLLNI